MSRIKDDIMPILLAPYLTNVAVTKVAPTALKMIDERTRKGKFLQSNTPGYSTKPIALNVIGSVTLSKSGIGFDSRSLNKKLKFSKSEYGWRTLNGKRYALLWGGYKKIREKSGRNTSFVDLTFTGKMLNSLDSQSKPISDTAVGVDITVSQDQQAKARFTNAKRPWLGLADTEIVELADVIKREIDKDLRGII